MSFLLGKYLLVLKIVTIKQLFMKKSATIQFVKRVCTSFLQFAYTLKYFYLFLGSKNLHIGSLEF